MIPYEDMTYRDWEFYWGQSILFTKPGDRWIPVRPSCVNEEGEYRHPARDSLERIDRRGGLLYFYTNDKIPAIIKARPMEPFHSKDWVTYEPPLGYFILNKRLCLLDCMAPRSRYKGLSLHRISLSYPVDPVILPKSSHYWIPQQSMGSIDVVRLAYEIADRMSDGFPEGWGDNIRLALSSNKPVILAPEVAVVPDIVNSRVVLLHNGVMLGTVAIASGALSFTPRSNKSQVEKTVSAWVRSKIEI